MRHRSAKGIAKHNTRPTNWTEAKEPQYAQEFQATQTSQVTNQWSAYALQKMDGTLRHPHKFFCALSESQSTQFTFQWSSRGRIERIFVKWWKGARYLVEKEQLEKNNLKVITDDGTCSSRFLHGTNSSWLFVQNSHAWICFSRKEWLLHQK